jgi:hypothetical protein
MKTLCVFAFIILHTALLFGQPQGNRLHYKYKIKQSTIVGYGHVLVLRTVPTVQAPTDPFYQLAPNRVRPASIAFTNGQILLDFWSIIDNLDTGLPGNYIHRNAPWGVYEIKQNPLRATLHDPTMAIKLKFDGFGLGISSVPFRYRFKAKIDDQTKTTQTVTSPRPDVAATIGYLWGHSTFSRRGVTHWPKTLGIMVGVSSAELKNGVVVSTSELYGSSKIQTNPALTYGFQFTFGRNNFGALIAVGFETNFGKYAKDWAYQAKPFIGLGLVANAGFF